jgi:hypothetical protein
MFIAAAQVGAPQLLGQSLSIERLNEVSSEQ